MSAAASVEVPRRADRRRALVIAYASIALVATVISAAVALDGATSDPVLVATARALIVGVPLGVGLYAWYAREEERFGVLLILAGGGWFLTALAESRDELPYTLGRAAGWLMELALVYLILAYPSGRLPGRTERLIVAGDGDRRLHDVSAAAGAGRGLRGAEPVHELPAGLPCERVLRP